MTHEQLWAPWRMAYIANKNESASQPEGCFLCRDWNEPAADAENFVVARGERTLVVLNRYPYNNGHLLIAPHGHQGELTDLDDATLLECQHWLQRMTTIYRRVLTPDGFNIGLNLGRVAGAGLPGHLHWHLVPRWNGDTNFMPVFAEVRVISQSLDALYTLLRSEMTAAS